MKDLSFFIRVYDDVLSQEMCNDLIEIYNKSKPVYYDNNIATFGEVNLNADKNSYKYIKKLSDTQIALTNQYAIDISPYEIPKPTLFEQYRIKKYTKQGKFDWHVDAVDEKSSKRYLSFLYYLSDGDADTIFFKELNMKISPKKGSVLIFPPMWMYPHKGDIVRNEKYIISSYLHY